MSAAAAAADVASTNDTSNGGPAVVNSCVGPVGRLDRACPVQNELDRSTVLCFSSILFQPV